MRFLRQFIGYRTIAVLLAVSCALAILDLASIAVVFPYLNALAADPPAPGSRLAALYELTNSHDKARFAMILSSALALFYAAKLVAGYQLNKLKFHTNARITTRLSDKLFDLLLGTNYSVLTNISVSETVGIINAETIHATLCVEALTTIASELLLLILVFVAIVWIDPRIAIVLIAVLTLLTGVLYFGVVRKTTRLGKLQADIHLRQYRFLYGIVSAIKDIKILGLERQVAAEHSSMNARYASAIASFYTCQSLPRGVVELVAMLGVLVTVAAVVIMQMDVKTAVPVIGLMAVAAWRVIPSYSRIMNAFGTYKYYRASLAVVVKLHDSLARQKTEVIGDARAFQRTLEIRDVQLSLGGTAILKGISLTIRKGESVGIVGLSGSGKTTLLDVLAGLRPADKGEFLLDGEPVDPFGADTLRRLLGYVPQNVTLVDDTVAFNITFEKEFDEQRLRSAARIARLGGFIESLPEGYATPVGENGVRVSGGQKQRIGIARALYRSPEIIIFDEATSALDNVTEQELNSEIDALSGDKTLIIVAHRLTTVSRCDTIHVVESGRIVGAGAHDELLAGCDAYRRLYLHGQTSSAEGADARSTGQEGLVSPGNPVSDKVDGR